MTPVQKNRVILGLKHRGHVVGFLGDGINDAPSLHTSDVGISVDGAVDVAKDAADIILLQQDLGALDRGIIEGRGAFGNIMKFIMMAMSSNFGNMFSMAGATLILPFLPMLPVQILLNNLLYAVSEMPRSAVPNRMVHRVARHPGAGDLRPAYPAQSATQPPASPPRRHVDCRRRCCDSAAFHTNRRVVRIRSTLCHLPLCHRRTDLELPGARTRRQIGILPSVATSCRPARAFVASASAVDWTIVTHKTCGQRHIAVAVPAMGRRPPADAGRW